MKKKILKALLTMAMAAAVFIGKGSEAKAYEDIGILEIQLMSGAGYVFEEYFDYDWYLQKHPELIEMYGTNKKAIYSFYENVGLANGWKGRVAFDKLIDASHFDYVRYAAENPDLAAVFGQDRAALYNHYITLGMKEGRKGYSTSSLVNAYVRLYQVSSQIMNDTMTDREKVKAVHDWMCLNTAYDYENYLNDTIPDESYYIQGVMNNGRAVCNGYAETFNAFMDVQGIECTEITGTADGGYHGWNKVKVDGEYYYIDVTWDDPVPDRAGRVRYDYYLTKDPTFGGDHAPYFE